VTSMDVDDEREPLPCRKGLPRQPWSASTFGDCCADMSTCWKGCFCNPCALGFKVAPAIGHKDFAMLWCVGLCCIQPLALAALRYMYREYLALEGSPTMDVVLSLCCCPCTACQLINETEYRYGDLSASKLKNAGTVERRVDHQVDHTN
jgi:Cys-rich protein (TIGR01571 family)